MQNSLRWSLPASLVLTGAAFGQVRVQMGPVPAQAAGGAPAVNLDSMYGKESAQGVYVRDSAA